MSNQYNPYNNLDLTSNNLQKTLQQTLINQKKLQRGQWFENFDYKTALINSTSYQSVKKVPIFENEEEEITNIIQRRYPEVAEHLDKTAIKIYVRIYLAVIASAGVDGFINAEGVYGAHHVKVMFEKLYQKDAFKNIYEKTAEKYKSLSNYESKVNADDRVSVPYSLGQLLREEYPVKDILWFFYTVQMTECFVIGKEWTRGSNRCTLLPDYAFSDKKECQNTLNYLYEVLAICIGQAILYFHKQESQLSWNEMAGYINQEDFANIAWSFAENSLRFLNNIFEQQIGLQDKNLDKVFIQYYKTISKLIDQVPIPKKYDESLLTMCKNRNLFVLWLIRFAYIVRGLYSNPEINIDDYKSFFGILFLDSGNRGDDFGDECVDADYFINSLERFQNTSPKVFNTAEHTRDLGFFSDLGSIDIHTLCCFFGVEYPKGKTVEEMAKKIKYIGDVWCPDRMTEYMRFLFYAMGYLQATDKNPFNERSYIPLNSPAKTPDIAPEIKSVDLSDYILKKEHNAKMHDLEKQISALKAENDKLKTVEKELSEVKEALWQSQNEEETEEEEIDIEFPVKLDRRVIVLSGEPKFLRSISEYLPDITPFDADRKIKGENLSGYDLIVILTKKISHSAYYAIMNFAKNNGIDTLLLNNFNAELAAKRIVEYCKSE